VYQAGSGLQHKALARGLGALPMEKQLEQLMDWLKLMSAQIPDTEGLTADQRERKRAEKNDQVLRV
jgi:transcription-repair coupling factor (superfamily II helicase)